MAVMINPPPRPWTARPATSWVMVVAVPESRSPARKATSPATSGRRGPRLSLSWPDATMPTTLATRNPVKAQPYAPRPWTARAAVGSAAATAIASNAISVTRMSSPMLVTRSAPAKIDGRSRVSAAVVICSGCKLKPSSIQTGRPPRGDRPARAKQSDGPWGRSGTALGDLVGELRGYLEEVTHDTEVGEFEDRGLGVLVDGDDRLGGLHAGAVLDRAGDADGDVELRRHGDAGLADLHGVRHPAGVDDSARGTDG